LDYDEEQDEDKEQDEEQDWIDEPQLRGWPRLIVVLRSAKEESLAERGPTFSQSHSPSVARPRSSS